MKRKIQILLPIIIVSLIAVSNQFFCSKEQPASFLFGDSNQSPLVTDTRNNKAGEIQNAFSNIFNLYKDKVVFITTEQFVRVRPHPFFDDPFLRDFFGGQRRKSRSRVQKRTGLGTGFIISADGYICTNHHVINGVDNVKVTIEKKSYNAKIVGSDKMTDIALLKINPEKKLNPIFFGDSDKVKVGNWAIAIGNPFGLDKTFTVGVISAIGRRDVDLMGSSHIQTDASINPGNSGGPLLNIKGEVIGINRMIYSKSGGYMGIGFAIPINIARTVLAQLKQFKKVKRGYIGVSIIPLSNSAIKQLGLKEPKGAFIGEILKGSPADKGGLMVGDVILSINDVEIKSYKDLVNIIGQIPINQRLKAIVWRNQKKVKLFIKVIERPGNK